MRLSEPVVLIPEGVILDRVAALAAEISSDYRRSGADELVLVGVLRGAYIFLADLSRLLSIPRRIDFVALSTYDKGLSSSGVQFLMDLRNEIKGKHVLIVEDIVDTGHTLRFLTDKLQKRAPASLRLCSLLQKPDRLEVDLRIDYLGFQIPDVWVVGYGLDCADQYRALPHVAKVTPMPEAADCGPLSAPQ